MGYKSTGNKTLGRRFKRGRKSKYGARKTVVDGITFDSEKEARRWQQLKALQDTGKIDGLQRQIKIQLIPAQREPDVIGPKGGRKPGKLIERECSYIADFYYIENGKQVVEDTKGVRTPEYIIKRKLCLWLLGIRIKEV